MTDLLTFIEATKGTSFKIEVTSKDLLEFADALVQAISSPSSSVGGSSTVVPTSSGS